LTVNRASEEVFEVNLIPHTLAVTNLSDFRTGTRVNMEVDMLARYIERLMAERKEP
jgi:riboflavin synthase